MSLNGVIATIAVEGARGYDNADIQIPTGTTDAQTDIEAAIATYGPGEYMILAGPNPVIDQSIVVTEERVTLSMESGVELEAAPTFSARASAFDSSYPLSAMVTAQANGFRANGVNVNTRTGLIPINGIQGVPRVVNGYYTDDNGTPCEDFEVSRCTVKAKNVHEYMIYSVLSKGAKIAGNKVIGDMTDGRGDPDNTAINVAGGESVSIMGNDIRNSSGFAIITWAHGAAVAARDGSLKRVNVVGNTADFCRYLFAALSYFDPVSGPNHIEGLTVDDLTGTNILAAGVYLDILGRSGYVSESRSSGHKTRWRDVSLKGLNCRYAPLDNATPPGPIMPPWPADPAARIALMKKIPGLIPGISADPVAIGLLSRAITATNTLLGDSVEFGTTAMENCEFVGSPNMELAHASLYRFGGMRMDNVRMRTDQRRGDARGLYAVSCPKLVFTNGEIDGAMREAMQLQGCTDAEIGHSTFRNWNQNGGGHHGISFEFGSGANIHDNGFTTSNRTGNPRPVDIVTGGLGEARNYYPNNRWIDGESHPAEWT